MSESDDFVERYLRCDCANVGNQTCDKCVVRAHIAELTKRCEEAEADSARLDWLDSANARLNAKYGTRYKWKVILNHNVARLMLGDMQVDLHDTDANGLPSCRLAIDEARAPSQRQLPSHPLPDDPANGDEDAPTPGDRE